MVYMDSKSVDNGGFTVFVLSTKANSVWCCLINWNSIILYEYMLRILYIIS